MPKKFGQASKGAPTPKAEEKSAPKGGRSISRVVKVKSERGY